MKQNGNKRRKTQTEIISGVNTEDSSYLTNIIRNKRKPISFEYGVYNRNKLSMNFHQISKYFHKNLL